MTASPATPELVAELNERLDAWEAALIGLESPASVQSRRMLENYRRTLARDLTRGIERVPASELRRAIATAEAATRQLHPTSE